MVLNKTKLSDAIGNVVNPATEDGNLAKLNVPLTDLAKLVRHGKIIEPSWVYGNEITAPAADSTLVSKTVSVGKTGFIYGFLITADEANVFRINWISGGVAKSIRITFSSGGTVGFDGVLPVNEGLGADPTTSITIVNVNAGGGDKVYQAGILYAEI
jgi:hypothetical protein